MRRTIHPSVLLCLLISAFALVTPRETDTDRRSLVITSTPPSLNLDDCLRKSYYGAYGSAQKNIYIASGECLPAVSTLESGTISPMTVEHEGGRLMWVGHAGVEGYSIADISAMDAWAGMQNKLSSIDVVPSGRLTAEEVGHSQRVFGQSAIGSGETVTLLYGSPTSLLLHVPDHLLSIIDLILPSHLVPVALPHSPLPHTFVETAMEWEPVPERFARHLANLTKHLKFDSKLDKILTEGIRLDEVRRNVRWLTGEAPSGIESRHSFTPGAIKAAHWIKEKAEATGAKCHLEPFLNGFSPNVICHYPSQTNSSELVILSAHYDSRGSWGSTRAPGGDDDGSGTGHLLGVAHAIGASELKFEKQVILAFFAGEEQGLLGSHAFAEKLHEKKATVLLHIQTDMLGYHAPGEPMQIGLPESIHLPEATYLVGNLSHLYSPELLVGRTAACCSDHQSFVAYGFPATQVFERAGPIADPKYHNSGDLSQREGYDFDQIVSIAKVTMASILTVAGWSI